jgi:hypothetical protein
MYIYQQIYTQKICTLDGLEKMWTFKKFVGPFLQYHVEEFGKKTRKYAKKGNHGHSEHKNKNKIISTYVT